MQGSIISSAETKHLSNTPLADVEPLDVSTPLKSSPFPADGVLPKEDEMDTDRVGQQFGSYRLTRPLGRRSFSEVYLGEHIHLGTLAAVKILHYNQLDKADLERFRIEARTIARLEHPNIVRLLDFGVEKDVPYLVMNYAPNGNLRQRHPKGKLLPLDIIVPYVNQVASALQYAHDQKLIHRDVKPQNMLIGRNNEVLLGDFGVALIAQSLHRDTDLQNMIGTITYMAPEAVQGMPRPASDQYALGIVVYEWLCGEPPFHGSFTEIAAQHMFTSLASLRAKVPLISPAVEQVVLKALAKDPQQRFPSVSAFAGALEQASQLTNTILSTLASPASSNSPQRTSSTPSGPYTPSVDPTQRTVWAPPQQSAYRSNPYSNVPSGQSPPNPYSQLPSYSAITPTFPSAYPAPQDPYSPASSFQPARQESLPVPDSRPRGRISRRAVVVGLVGLVGLAAAEVVANRGLIWQSPPSGQKVPIGTTFYIYHGHPKPVLAVAWSPDGTDVVSGSQDTTAQVWDASSGKTITIYPGHSQSVESLAWLPHSNSVVSGSDDQTVQLWDAHTGKASHTYRGHTTPVYTVACSPDGTRIASGGRDEIVLVWEVSTGYQLLSYQGHAGGVGSVAWSPDGKSIASASYDGTVHVWDAATGKLAFKYTGHTKAVFAVAWSPNGKSIASGGKDQSVQIWNAKDGQRISSYNEHSAAVEAVAWSPDSTHVASSGDDKTVLVWNVATGSKTVSYDKHSDKVIAVAWSPDGTRIASGSYDHTVQVWQAM